MNSGSRAGSAISANRTWFAAILWLAVRSTGLSSPNHSSPSELRSPRCSGNGWPSLIGSGPQFGIAARGLPMLSLNVDWADVSVACRHLFFWPRTSRDAAGTAIEAHAIDGNVVDNGLVIYVPHIDHVGR